jgi:hypothetical protein
MAANEYIFRAKQWAFLRAVKLIASGHLQWVRVSFGEGAARCEWERIERMLTEPRCDDDR